jgi:hypothetical protein
MKFEGRKVFGIVLIIAGIVFILNSFVGITGFAVLEGVFGEIGEGWSFVIGLVLVGGALVFLLKKEVSDYLRDYQIRQEAHSISNKIRMTEEYRFQEATGYPSKNPNAWVTFYHAYPRDRKFKKGRFDESLADDGFYLAENPREALEVIRGMHNIEFRDISVMKVKIAKNVAKGILEPSGEYERIPKKKIKNANKLIAKGFIRLEEM